MKIDLSLIWLIIMLETWLFAASATVVIVIWNMAKRVRDFRDDKRKLRTIIVAGEEVPCCVGEVFNRGCDYDCPCSECGRKRFPKARVIQDPALVEACRRNFT
jgi:hypothetical protein